MVTPERIEPNRMSTPLDMRKGSAMIKPEEVGPNQMNEPLDRVVKGYYIAPLVVYFANKRIFNPKISDFMELTMENLLAMDMVPDTFKNLLDIRKKIEKSCSQKPKLATCSVKNSAKQLKQTGEQSALPSSAPKVQTDSGVEKD